VFPTIIYGGISFLRLLIDKSAGYVNKCDSSASEPLSRRTRARGVLLVLSLVALDMWMTGTERAILFGTVQD
jgi:hypothetical protein